MLTYHVTPYRKNKVNAQDKSINQKIINPRDLIDHTVENQKSHQRKSCIYKKDLKRSFGEREYNKLFSIPKQNSSQNCQKYRFVGFEQ